MLGRGKSGKRNSLKGGGRKGKRRRGGRGKKRHGKGKLKGGKEEGIPHNSYILRIEQDLSERMLPLATHCHIHYHLHPFH